MPGSLCFRKGMRMNIGIYRRVDDLGRIVIPKEVRRQVHLEEGDMMEISVDGRQLILTPYASVTDADIIVRACVNGWKKNESMILAVTTKLDIFASTDTNLKQHIMLSEELRSRLTCRKEYITDGISELPLTDEEKQWVLAMFPYMPNFELQGTVVLVGGKHEVPTEVQIEKARLIADMISTAIESI